MHYCKSFSSSVSNAAISHINLTWLLTIQSTQQCVTGAFLVIMINSISRNNNERPGLQEVRKRPSWRETRGKEHMLDKELYKRREQTAEGARENQHVSLGELNTGFTQVHRECSRMHNRAKSLGNKVCVILSCGALKTLYITIIIMTQLILYLTTGKNDLPFLRQILR